MCSVLCVIAGGSFLFCVSIVTLFPVVSAAGALKVFFASAAPPVRFSNVYGIDIPTRSELIAHNLSVPEIAEAINADMVMYVF